MNKLELHHHLTQIEWNDFEIKKDSNEVTKSAWGTVSALSNISGEYLVFCAKETSGNYEITGVKNFEKIQNDFLI